jgi:thiol:disulfide interchange protein DsbD
MHTFKGLILGLLIASPAAYSLSGNVVATDNVKARLVSETNAIVPGQSVWVALELDIRDGWHTYWRNPGDSGQATSLAWSLPPGFTAGEIVWTTPHRFELPPLVNYGYAKHAVHLVEVTAPKDLKLGRTVLLQAKASWLVCSDVCVPEDANLQLNLPVSATAAAAPADAALFAAARSDLPTPEPASSSARLQNGQLVITLGKMWGPALSQIESLAFYPYDEGSIEYGAPQALTRSNGTLELAVKAGYQPPHGGTVRGVLLATETSGGNSVAVPMEIAATFNGGAGPPAGASTPPAAVPALPSLILLAILGGLILNLMPCVFPVLSIKAIGLVEQAKKHPAAVRAKGLVFAAGVVSSMLSLAVILLALRAGGEQIGWGFQLQSPLFVTLMVYLLLAVGLNLSGVFEVGGGLAGVGDGLTRGDGYRASFFTGVLTTLVATPCTAPFMAAAVGAALTQSPLVALVIFASLGVGLSLPYLLLSFAPWLRRALPKPGAWMDTLKQVFAFPMYASAAWLLWVLAQQTSSLGLGAALAGAILIALAAWAYQKSKFSGLGGRVTAVACCRRCGSVDR